MRRLRHGNETTGYLSSASHNVSRKTLRSSWLISITLVSNEPCRVRALHRSFASRNARPNSLEESSVTSQRTVLG